MSEFFVEESSRCLHCKVPRCKKGCPVHYDVPQFLQLVNSGKLQEAIKVVGHPFGEVCGYVCPRDKQCKGHCVLGAKGAPVDVGAVERNVFARAFSCLQKEDDCLAHLKVAVVGGGVSGVTFAAECYKHGSNVTVFEKNSLLHTLQSIPSFRLPKAALQRIVSAVESSPVKVEKRQISNEDLPTLRRDFDVVYLATGVSFANKLNIEGEQFVTDYDEFLRGDKRGRTIVVGGGNTAMDCARLNARSGNQTIVAYRRTRQDMPAFSQEIEQAQEEGVHFRFNFAPVSVKKGQDGLEVTFAQTVSEGRGKLVVTDRTEKLSCDVLVAATGSRFDCSVWGASGHLCVDERNRLCDNIFAGGDAVGKSLVVEAVADALSAARSVLEDYKR